MDAPSSLPVSLVLVLIVISLIISGFIVLICRWSKKTSNLSMNLVVVRKNNPTTLETTVATDSFHILPSSQNYYSLTQC